MSIQDKLLKAAAGDAPGGITPSENFSIVTYSGTSATQSITGVGFKPDWVWIKRTDGAENNYVQDSTRGSTKQIYTNLTNAEFNETGAITSFDSDGFTMGSYNGINNSGEEYVAWCWKANGGTTSSNTDGSITSTVQTNTDAGFSIVKYTGNGSSSATVGHNLGAIPDLTIFKQLDSGGTSGGYWNTYLTSNNTVGFLNADNAFVSNNGGTNGSVDISNMSSTTFGFLNGSSSANNQNNSGTDYIVYCFKSIDSFSKIGTYTGNGSADGPIVETGFEPAFLIVKGTSNTGSWLIFDNKRNTTNPRNKVLRADSSAAETTSSTIEVDFLSNGFQLTGTDTDYNGSARTYIYMAFAADPDTEAPALASSFNIETYTGDGTSNRQIDTLGFKPGLFWQKTRATSSSCTYNNLFDIVRGGNKTIYSNATDAEVTEQGCGYIQSFDDNGVTYTGDASGINNSGEDFVIWSWKADDNEPTLFGGNAIAVYKFEDNANDVTGDYNGTASNVSYVTGKFNKAADFNGSNSKITFSTGFSQQTSFTVSFWMKSSQYNDDHTIFQFEGDSNVNSNRIGLASSGTKFGIFPNNTTSGAGFTAMSASDSTALYDGSYHHVALVVDGTSNTSAKIYIDGVSKALTTGESYTTTMRMTGNMRIGTRKDDDSNSFYDGEIDQLRIYNGAVSDIGVAALYAETTSDNDDLSLAAPKETIISANANAGFSIVKYEGNGVTGTKIPHGLSATPEMIIVKNLSSSTAWAVFHTSIGATQYLSLNETTAVQTATNVWNDTAPNSTTFTVGTWSPVNNNGDEHIAYCFHSVSNFSDFGTYTGNGSSTSVSVGFKPDFVVVKATNNAENWYMQDTLRGVNNILYADGSFGEGTSSGVSFTSTGFTVTSSFNQSGRTFIYWAMAKNVPSNTTLADSFKVVTYTGTGSAQSITGFGFKPDLLWIKNRDAADNHFLVDAVRRPNELIFPNIDNAETTATGGGVASFDSDGFSLQAPPPNYGINLSNLKLVAWGWKAGNTWQSNTNGTIQSLTNANTANGFSIVKWKTNGSSSQTVGHGLSSTPEIIFFKRLDSAQDWFVETNAIDGGYDYANLNSNAAFQDGGSAWSTRATSTTITAFTNNNNFEYVAYCWHSVSGYSDIGSYTGNGGSNSITGLGFQPDFLMIKSSGSGSWGMYDSQRTVSVGDNAGTANARPYILANTDGKENGATSANVNLDSDGFSMNTSSGDLNTNSTKYLYMAFKMNPTPQPLAGYMSFLVIAGGGSGGARDAGPGGAGGLRTSYGDTSGGGASAESNITLAAGTYTITVGAGGAARVEVTSVTAGASGSDSSIAASGLTTITSTGGGAGGTNTQAAGTGGSGGGGTGSAAAGSGTSGQGYAGGSGIPNWTSGGGGGASEAGNNAPSNENGGDGGDGLAVEITGSSVTYAGGGGGSGDTSSGSGGTGGGGAGQSNASLDATSGTANTGGGGGSHRQNLGTSGAGGSGVVILRLLTSEYSGTTTGSPTVTTDGDHTIIKYTGSGTYVHS